MARPNFFNDNENRSFPFVHKTVGVRTPASGPVTMLELPDDFIVDCGFILGPESGFIEGEHSVFLYKITKLTESIFSFEFRSDAPTISQEPLIFYRNGNDSKYITEFVESDVPITVITSQSESISIINDVPCGEPFWSGYLVTGDMESVSSRLTNIGDYITTNGTGQAVVEPALIQNLNNNQLVSINIANEDRTRALRPSECDPFSWSFNTGSNFVDYTCLQGDIKLKPGYNLSLTQNASTNTIQFAPVINAGLGTPCSEVKLFDAEQPPTNATNSLLEGDFYCNEAVRTINGVQGPAINFFAGNGVAITGDQVNNKINVDVNLVDLALCAYSEVSESI